MNKKKIIVSAALILSMLLPLSACGKGRGSNLFDGGTKDNEPLEIPEATHYFETNYIDKLPSTFINLGRVFLVGDSVVYRGNDDGYTTDGIYSYNINTGKETTIVTTDESYYELNYDPTDERGTIYDFTVDDEGNVYYLYHTWQTDPIINETDFSQTTEADLVNFMIDNWGFELADANNELANYYESYKKDDGTPDYGAIMKSFRSGEYPTIDRYYIIKADMSGNEIFKVEFNWFNQTNINARNAVQDLDASATASAEDVSSLEDDNSEESEGIEKNESFANIDDISAADSAMIETPAVDSETDSGYFGGYMAAMMCDAKGNLYLSYDLYDENGDYYFIEVFDDCGNNIGKTENDYYVDTLVRLADGSVAAKKDDYEVYNSSLYRVDQNGKIDTTKDPAFSTGKMFYKGSFLSDSELLYISDRGLDYIKNGESDSELYLKWLDCDIPGNSVMDFSVMSDGRIVVYTSTYDMKGSRGDIVILNEIDKSQVKEKTILRLATVYLDSQFENQIVDFNKKNNDYHVDVIAYEMSDDEDDYDAALNRYIISLLSDDSIDILALNYSEAYNHIINFAQKGLMIDLNEVIENDPEISTDMFAENIIAPFYYKDKLIALPSDFGIRTLVGGASSVGSKVGWSGADAEAAIAKLPDGANVALYYTREDALEYCISANYSSLVDDETGKCNFDSDVFKDCLVFASHFPEEVDYDAIWDSGISESEMYRNKTLLLSDYYLGSVTDLQFQRALFGDDITFVGFPVAQGNGALISYSGIYGITTHCEDPSAAWQVLRILFLPRDEERYYYSNNSIRKDDLEKFFNLAQDPNNVEVGQIYSWSGVEVEIEPASDSDVELVKDIYYNSSAMYGCVPQDVMDIIMEEAGAYFANQKSIDEIASNVQSRVKIYLSETR